jgi:hypothetical protein
MAARALHQVGVQCWDWPPGLEPYRKLSKDNPVVGAGDRCRHLQAEAPAMLQGLEALLEASSQGAELDSEPERSRWESVAISLEVATLFLPYEWAYEKVGPCWPHVSKGGSQYVCIPGKQL